MSVANVRYIPMNGLFDRFGSGLFTVAVMGMIQQWGKTNFAIGPVAITETDGMQQALPKGRVCCSTP
ncbi:hypothetical protein P0082_06335 [Candidatus Haliotispira prima]|uniref:Uncharacterized protein n=1 Tax=Candidatus Haliotispira prima TaxID=3034016 RepID=A0ABY8MFV1_9SPIO|nr:hypothetical protein P0082_06335 [Candidatus Haliotispira prima]